MCRKLCLPPPGGPLLWILDGRKPLSSQRINSLTKELLQQYGIPVSHWTAHSTRGAGVLLYKNLGLSSEEVCELGQWKNAQAFTNHYLRLGAVEKASIALKKVPRNVHTASPHEGAEPEGLRTPGKDDTGGSNPEGEAQEGGEVLPLVAGSCFGVFLCPGLFLPRRCRSWR